MSFLNPQAFQPIRRRLLYPLVSNGKGRRLMATIDALNGTTSVEQKKGLLDFKTLHELQRVACDVYSENSLYGTYNESTSRFEYLNYNDFGRKVEDCRVVLQHLGVNQYDKIGIISNNRYEWAMIAAATYSLNATLVPMYEAQLPKDWQYIINDSSATAVFCSTKDIFDCFQKEVLPMTPKVHSTLCLDAIGGEEYEYKTVTSHLSNRSFPEHLPIATSPDEEDLANLIYTSGTTGKPKGVELTHRNVVSNIKGGMSMTENPFHLLDESSRTLAFLPWAHSYGQTCELWMGMAFGSSTAICRGVPFLLEDLLLVKPSVLFAVPTLYKKIYDGVRNKMESGHYVQDELFKKAIQAGCNNAEFLRGERGSLSFSERVKFNFLNRLVLSKIRDRFGGNLKYGCVAGAACPTEVLKFMDAIGIPIIEGYGLTESSPIIALNAPGKRSIGSVGLALNGVEVFVVNEDGGVMPPGEEGEICCVGPNVMRGYHNNEEATNEVISTGPDGISKMLHTGDLGRMDAEGWISVTGRIKEQYKLENGKYVVPAPVENAIGISRFISQVVLIGANRPYNVALLVPDWAAIRHELHLEEFISDVELSKDRRVSELIDDEITKNCSQLKKFEVPRAWAFVPPFSVADNTLTPKMTIRKHAVLKAYGDLISSLYVDKTVDSNKLHPTSEVA